MAIEIVDFPIKNGGSFHSYVSLPEGMFVSLCTDCTASLGYETSVDDEFDIVVFLLRCGYIL